MNEKQYRDELIQMINSINDIGMLIFFHRMIKLFKKKWGI